VTNLPIQDITSINSVGYIDITPTILSTYKVSFTDQDSITASWYALFSSLAIRNWNTINFICPTWFIAVPWNFEFHSDWFCISQYEMWYTDVLTPNSDWWAITRNTVKYLAWKTITSKQWLYPIADITQQQAIDACWSMWGWYHLVTNNEWMTIARNIESVPWNWSENLVWNWYLYNWVSNETTQLWCSANWLNTEPRANATKTWPWTDTFCNTKRMNVLSNWQEIRDLSWNVHEHVNKANTSDWINYNIWLTTFAWCSPTNTYDTDWICSIVDMAKYSSTYFYWNSKWMWGIIYSSWINDNVFIRWASATDATNAWIYTIRLENTKTKMASNIGFRCAK
jgi:hypothetical protein